LECSEVNPCNKAYHEEETLCNKAYHEELLNLQNISTHRSGVTKAYAKEVKTNFPKYIVKIIQK